MEAERQLRYGLHVIKSEMGLARRRASPATSNPYGGSFLEFDRTVQRRR
ncbi:hypothetical protein HYS97_01065 [Candidatus Daviesbacteria bacterium]|nr:hypothetical protein [Candidatus Daviesbacteria bacterium]